MSLYYRLRVLLIAAVSIIIVALSSSSSSSSSHSVIQYVNGVNIISTCAASTILAPTNGQLGTGANACTNSTSMPASSTCTQLCNSGYAPSATPASCSSSGVFTSQICNACAANSYALAGAIVCTQCASNYYSTAGASVCTQYSITNPLSSISVYASSMLPSPSTSTILYMSSIGAESSSIISVDTSTLTSSTIPTSVVQVPNVGGISISNYGASFAFNSINIIFAVNYDYNIYSHSILQTSQTTASPVNLVSSVLTTSSTLITIAAAPRVNGAIIMFFIFDAYTQSLLIYNTIAQSVGVFVSTSNFGSAGAGGYGLSLRIFGMVTSNDGAYLYATSDDGNYELCTHSVSLTSPFTIVPSSFSRLCGMATTYQSGAYLRGVAVSADGSTLITVDPSRSCLYSLPTYNIQYAVATTASNVVDCNAASMYDTNGVTFGRDAITMYITDDSMGLFVIAPPIPCAASSIIAPNGGSNGNCSNLVDMMPSTICNQVCNYVGYVPSATPASCSSSGVFTRQSCSPCAANTFAVSGATVCTPCALGYTSFPSSSMCTYASAIAYSVTSPFNNTSVDGIKLGPTSFVAMAPSASSIIFVSSTVYQHSASSEEYQQNIRISSIYSFDTSLPFAASTIITTVVASVPGGSGPGPTFAFDGNNNVFVVNYNQNIYKISYAVGVTNPQTPVAIVMTSSVLTSTSLLINIAASAVTSSGAIRYFFVIGMIDSSSSSAAIYLFDSIGSTLSLFAAASSFSGYGDNLQQFVAYGIVASINSLFITNIQRSESASSCVHALSIPTDLSSASTVSTSTHVCNALPTGSILFGITINPQHTILIIAGINARTIYSVSVADVLNGASNAIATAMITSSGGLYEPFAMTYDNQSPTTLYIADAYGFGYINNFVATSPTVATINACAAQSIVAPINGGLGACNNTVSMAANSTCIQSCTGSGYVLSSTPASCSVNGVFTAQICVGCSANSYGNGAICNICPNNLSSPYGSSSVSACVQQPCTMLTAPTYGSAGTCTVNPMPSGTNCTQLCGGGYILTGAVASCYQGSFTPQTCSACAANTYAAAGAISCTACASGYTSSSGSSSCSPMPCTTLTTPINGAAGGCTTNPMTSGTSCSQICNAGYLASSVQASCVASVFTAQICNPCAANSYSSLAGSTACTPCTTGTTCPAASTSSSACVPIVCAVPTISSPATTGAATTGAVTSAPAYTSTVVPSAYASTPGTGEVGEFLNGYASSSGQTVQVLYTAGDLGFSSGTSVYGLSFRLNNLWAPALGEIDYTSFSIDLENVPATITGASFLAASSFAANSVGAMQRVYSATNLALPAGFFPSGANPESASANAFSQPLAFSAAFVYTGASIVLTLRHAQPTLNPPTESYWSTDIVGDASVGGAISLGHSSTASSGTFKRANEVPVTAFIMSPVAASGPAACGATLAYGATCVTSCIAGYVPASATPSSSSCNSTGSFVPQPACIPCAANTFAIAGATSCALCGFNTQSAVGASVCTAIVYVTKILIPSIYTGHVYSVAIAPSPSTSPLIFLSNFANQIVSVDSTGTMSQSTPVSIVVAAVPRIGNNIPVPSTLKYGIGYGPSFACDSSNNLIIVNADYNIYFHIISSTTQSTSIAALTSSVLTTASVLITITAAPRVNGAVSMFFIFDTTTQSVMMFDSIGMTVSPFAATSIFSNFGSQLHMIGMITSSDGAYLYSTSDDNSVNNNDCVHALALAALLPLNIASRALTSTQLCGLHNPFYSASIAKAKGIAVNAQGTSIIGTDWQDSTMNIIPTSNVQTGTSIAGVNIAASATGVLWNPDMLMYSRDWSTLYIADDNRGLAAIATACNQYSIVAPQYGSMGACSNAAPMAFGATCAQKCSAGYAPSSTLASCSNNAVFTPQICNACSINSYAPAGASICTSCPNGFGSPALSTSASACAPLPCTTLTAPTYGSAGACTVNPMPSGTNCTQICGGGYILTGAVASCYQGSFTPQTCSPCAANTYAAAGAMSCTACASGYTSLAGSSSCSPMPCTTLTTPINGAAGLCTTNPMASGTSCNQACLNGYSISSTQSSCFASVFTHQNCSSCAANTYALTGATSCTNCTFGYTSPVAASACTPMPCTTLTLPSFGTAGTCTINPMASGASCVQKCNGGYMLAGGSTASPASCFASVFTPQLCTICAANTYSSAGSTSCTPCSSGFVSIAGSSSCHPKLPVDLASCAAFSVFSGTLTSAGPVQTNVVSGRVGSAPGSLNPVGNIISTYSSFDSGTALALQCRLDITAAYATGQALGGYTRLASTKLSGLTLGPGRYSSGSSLSLISGILTLDGGGDIYSQFVFNAATSLFIGAGARILLTNGASSDGVFWLAGANVALGAGSAIYGQVIAGGMVNVGASASVNGRVYAASSISFANDGLVDPDGLSPPSTIRAAPNVRFASFCAAALSACPSSFALFAGVSLAFGSGNTISGDYATFPSLAISGGPAWFVSGQNRVYGFDASTVASVVSSFYMSAASMCPLGGTLIPGELGGRTLVPGIYCAAGGAFNIGDGATLTLSPGLGVTNPPSQFVFAAPTTLTTGTGSIIATSDPSIVASDVIFALGTSINIGSSNSVVGTFIAGVSATVGASSVVQGRVFAMVAVTLSSNVRVTTTAWVPMPEA